MMITRRAFWRCSLTVVLLLLASPFALSFVGLLPWSPINCWHYDVDIRSGQMRYTRYFAFFEVAQRVEDSALSRALHPEGSPPATADWRRVLTFSPGVRNSPHYSFHSAIGQIRELETYWRIGKFTPAAQCASARAVLQLWQEEKCDDTVKPYLAAIQQVVMRQTPGQEATDEKDLPPIRGQTTLAKP